MPTGKQIRAARVFAGIDAEELAGLVKMTRISIQNLERGDTIPKPENLEKIVNAFSEMGIEFTENEGVRRRPSGVEVLEGVTGFARFYDFLYDRLKHHGGEVCLSVVDSDLLRKYRKDPRVHRRRMKKLVDSGSVRFRVLATKSPFVSDYAEIRWQPSQSSTPTSFYAFGDCLALISFVHNPPPYVIVIQSAPLTEAYRKFFDLAWEKAGPLPQQPGKAP
jgi:transcriptional regulator with XRE-family HTH domain